MAVSILHIIPELSSGGAERQLVDIVCNTSNQEFSHTICLLRSENFYLPNIRMNELEVIALDLKGKYPWLKAAHSIHKIVKRIRPDIIHSWLFDGDISARFVKLLNPEIPLITSLQSPAYEPDTIRAAGLSPIKVNGLRLIDAGLAWMTNPMFIACSHFVATSAVKRLRAKRSRVSVIFNSVDTATLNCESGAVESIRRELGISPEAFVYLGVGRLDAGKGFADLIRAFRTVANSAPDSYLVIVGAGVLESDLRHLIVSLKLERNVILTGRRKDVGACLEMADAFVCPTLFEGLSIALIEAMSKGLPCIASRLPVLEEVIDHSSDGLLATVGSEKEWSGIMLRVYEDPTLRERLGTAALKKVEAKFTSKVLMPQWEAMYRQISNT